MMTLTRLELTRLVCTKGIHEFDTFDYDVSVSFEELRRVLENSLDGYERSSKAFKVTRKEGKIFLEFWQSKLVDDLTDDSTVEGACAFSLNNLIATSRIFLGGKSPKDLMFSCGKEWFWIKE